MKDNRRCFICEKKSPIRKDRAICSFCINQSSKFRGNVRSSIYSSFKYGMKSYIWTHLPYSLSELKAHLEDQFELWMNWSNYGVYNSKTWNDNDISTWTWQIDHIIPQSNFIFTSVSDINFTDCWSLDNLRPLASKKNIKKHIKENYEA